MNDLLYLTSSSYSGSTLVTFLLATHPQVATVGELKATSMGDVEEYKCSCGILIRSCPFWARVTQELVRRGTSFDVASFGTHFALAGRLADRAVRTRVRGRAFERARKLALRALPGAWRELNAILERNRVLIEVICHLEGKPVFLDDSKEPSRLMHMLNSGLWNVKVVYLVRDGRGVAHSILRRHKRFHPDVPASGDAAAHEWRQTQESIERVLDRLPSDSWVKIRYEDVCADPRTALQPVLRLIGQGGVPLHEEFRAGQHHILGNYMRLRAGEQVSLNEKWRTELSAEELAGFERVAGDLNRRHGYV
jgi:hypothetical protein